MMVHRTKLRWLAWLRLKILARSFQRSPRLLVLSILAVVFLLFVSTMAGIGLFALFTNVSSPVASELLYLLFTGMLLLWIMLPLLSYSTNEGLDITKLQLFPLTRLEIMCSLLFSSLFDIWTVVILVIFATLVVIWGGQSLALGLFTLLVVLLFYVLMVGVSQLILALLMRTLQSRKFRDISIIILALFGSSCYLLQRFTFSASNMLNMGQLLKQQAFSPVLQWFPSGVPASAIRAASQGDWGTGFLMVGLLVVICAVVLYLWQLVLERSMVASETGASRRKRQATQATQATGASLAGLAPAAVSVSPIEQPHRTASPSAPVLRTGRISGTIPLFPQLQALVKKELTCYWRDPQLKVRLFQIGIYVIIFVVLPLYNTSSSPGRGASVFAGYTPFTSAAVVFLYMLTLSQNTLGIERESLSALFLFPIDRRRLLWGKNLAIGLLGFSLLVILMIACFFVSHEQNMVLPATVIGLSGLGVALGWSNIASVYFPRYQPQMGRKGYSATGGQAQSGGCLNTVMSLLMTIVTIISLAPVALAIGLPFFLNMQWLWLLTIPLSLLYGVGLYILLTNRASQRLLETEPEILTVTTRVG